MNKLLIFLFAILAIPSVHAQTMQLFDIDTTKFPIMKAKFFAFEKDGSQIGNFSTTDFDLLEDGISRKIQNIARPKIETPKAISSVLTLDVSGSMKGRGLVNLKSAANSWINGLQMANSECAITTFSDNSSLIQDFTTDKNKLIQSINSLNAQNGSNYDEALWQSTVSGLEIAKNGIYNRILIFLTDGNPINEPQTQKIIDLANQYKVVVYCVVLNISAPNYLKDISTKTGGLFYDNITTEEETRNTFLKILNISQNINPCTIEWESDIQCQKSYVNVELTLKTLDINTKCSYNLPQKGIAYIDVKPSGLNIWNIPPGNSKDTSIVIKAINADFNITNITGINQNFSITPKSFFLKMNESKTLTITYTPTDSLIDFRTFDLINDKCKASIFIRAGFKGHKLRNSTFKVTHPNGGESFGIGTDTVITWEGCSPDEIVTLEYSFDDGKTYKSITSNATGLKYVWKDIPNIPSTKCLLKASLGQKPDTNDIKIFGFGELCQVIYSPDGTKLASCGGGGIFIWNISTGDTVLSIRENTGFINCIAFSPDGTKIVSGSKDNLIKLWNLKTGQLIKTFLGHNGNVKSVAINHDGCIIAGGSNDNTIKLWNVNTGIEIKTLKGHTGYVNSLSFSHDGLELASGSDDLSIKLWDVNTGTEIKTFSGHTDHVNSVSFSPDGIIIASGSNDKSIKLWNVNTGLEIKTLLGHFEKVNCVSFSQDGKNLVSSSDDKYIRIWDIKTYLEIKTLAGDEFSGSIYNVVFSPDGKNLASANGNQTIKLWDVNFGIETKTLYGHTLSVNSINFSPDGNKIVSGGWDNQIRIWDINTGKIIKTLSGHSDIVWSAIYSPDGSKIASSGEDKNLKLWDVNLGTQIRTFYGQTSWLNNLCFNPSGTILMGAIDYYNIKFWDVNTGSELKSLFWNTGSLNCLGMNYDGSILASGSENTINLWNAKTGDIIKKILNNTGYVYSVCFNPEGNKLASGGVDKTIKIWDVNSGNDLITLTGHNGCIYSVCFSPDGSKLASSSDDNTIKLWDVNTGAEIRTLTGHSGYVTSVGFNPDGSKIASGSADCTIRIWTIDEVSPIEDISDSVWSIVAPKSVSKDLDFSKVLVGTSKDSLVESFVINMSICKSRVDSIKISGINSDQFSFFSDIFPSILEAKEAKNVEFRFKPTSIGKKTAKVYIYTAVDTVINNISGEGIMPQLSVINASIDFGKVTIGEFKDTISVATIKNTGSAKLNITATKHDKPNDKDFTTISGGGSFTLAPDETHTMTLRFTARNIGLTIGTLNFEYDGIGSPAKITLIGEGLAKNIAEIEFKAGTISGYPGDIVSLPIILSDRNKIPISSSAKINIDLSFNSTLLLPLDYQSMTLNGTKNKITINNLPLDQNIGDTIAVIHFKVGLGNAEQSELILSNGYTVGDTVNITAINGTFKLLGICPAGGNRLINPTGKINITSIKPNPSNENIEVKMELLELNGYTLTIVNSNGQKVREIYRTNSNNGIKTENIDVSELASGVYNLILQTESERISKLFLILK